MSHTCSSQRQKYNPIRLYLNLHFWPMLFLDTSEGHDEALQTDMQRTNTEMGPKSPNQILSLIPSFSLSSFIIKQNLVHYLSMAH